MTTPAVTTVSIDQLQQKISVIRKTMKAAGELVLTFRDKPLSGIVPHDRLQAERDELAQLRARVAELEQLVALQRRVIELETKGTTAA